MEEGAAARSRALGSRVHIFQFISPRAYVEARDSATLAADLRAASELYVLRKYPYRIMRTCRNVANIINSCAYGTTIARRRG